MEESLNSFDMKDLYGHILERFNESKGDMRTYSPLALAYIGDGIFDLVIRSMEVGKGNTKASQLHQHTSHIVKAHSQAVMMEYILPSLTEEEESVFRRGRNAKSPTMAKNATMSDYRHATGFEALMGYLYMNGEMERMLDLIELGLEGFAKSEASEGKKPKKKEK